MEQITSINAMGDRLLNKLKTCIVTIRDLVQREVSSIDEGIATLRHLRRKVYEDLNQVQHESLLLTSVRWLEANIPQCANAEWYWNPRQTGGSTEPDLRCVRDGQIIVSAEATTSEEPKGSIDTRMRDTLAKLSEMPGQRYYFVRTESMAQRARGKVLNNRHDIKIITL